MLASTSCFVMRQEPWDALEKGLLDADSTPRNEKVVVLSGVPGCGKSYLARRFMTEHRSKYRYVLFIDGSSKATIQADLVKYVKRAHPVYSDATFADAIHFFSNPVNHPWLLAFDGVDSDDIDLTSLLPPGTLGSIILTTRSITHGQFASEPELHLELDVMSDEESTEAIIQSASLDPSEENKQSAMVIANKLGNLPVALIQAGSYMLQTGCSCEEYLSLLQRRTSEMIDQPMGDLQRQCAYAAFDLCYERLPFNIQAFIRLMGCVHNTNFPMNIIKHSAATLFQSQPFQFIDNGPEDEESVKLLMSTFCPTGDWDECTLGDIADTLQEYAMASFSDTSRGILLHMQPLLHDRAFGHILEEDKPLYRAAASRLLACASTKNDFVPLLVPHINNLLPTASESPIGLNEVAAFAKTLQKMKYLWEARLLWQDIHDKVIELHGSRSVQAALAAFELSLTIYHDLAEKTRLQMECIEIREHLLGSSHLETVYANDKLAGTLQLQGCFDEAEILLLEVIEEYKRQLGPFHRETVNTMSWLAHLYATEGHLEEAQSLYESVLEIRRTEFGPEHLDTLVIASSLAKIYSSQGLYEEAEELQLHVIEERSKQLGADYPSTLMEMQNLAHTYSRQRRNVESIHLREKTLEIWRTQLGEMHPHTLRAMFNLAYLYGFEGRYTEAGQLQDCVLQQNRAQFGDTHEMTVTVMANLATTYFKQGLLYDSNRLNEELLKYRKEKLGENHPLTMESMRRVISYYTTQPDRREEAASLQRKVVKYLFEADEESDRDALQAMDTLAYIYGLQGKHHEAEDLQTKIYKKRNSLFGPSDMDTLHSLGSLAHLQRSRCRYSEAVRSELQLLEERRSIYGEDHPLVAKSLWRLAWTYFQRGALTEAMEFVMQAEALQKELFGTEHKYYLGTVRLMKEIETAQLFVNTPRSC